MPQVPLIAYNIALGDENPKYSVYSDAYGLDMSYDDEAEIETVIFTEPRYTPRIAFKTDIRSLGVEIGISSPPRFFDLAIMAGWALSELAGIDQSLPGRRKHIVHCNCDDRLIRFINHASRRKGKLAAVAIHAVSLDGLAERAANVRASLDSANLNNVRVISYVASDDVDIQSLVNVDHTEGIYHPSSSYDEMLTVMSLFAPIYDTSG